ncbi:MAG: polyprenyl synthetase family protein, partial [Blastocatellia bacterium]|nr:polyprenyl synthetase family protein [Blastocatellia bacterium]
GADETAVMQLRQFGLLLGIAFQLTDDLLGVFGNEADTGKSTVGDIREGKHTYLAAPYQRLVKRKGKQKALVAVAHSILVMVYHILQRQENYHELGGDYFDRQDQQKQQQQLLRQLQALGLQVTVTPLPAAA